MPILNEIEKNIEAVSIIKNITEAYHQIANLRMKQIKERVLKTRYFFNELLNICQRVQSASFYSKKKKKSEKIFRKTEKEEIVIFLSANEFFYGSLILDIWKETEKYVSKRKVDLLIVGRIGKYLAERSGWGQKFFYFELDDVEPEKEKISEIFDFIQKYKKIIVFHGVYEKILLQKPKMTEISSYLPSQKKLKKEREDYLFEPSIEEILAFFETEIVNILLSQTIFEHQLAKLASRVISMHEANEKAKETEKKLTMIKQKLKKEKINRKQVEYFGKIIFLQKNE